MFVWIRDSCPWLTAVFESAAVVSSATAQTQHSCSKQKSSRISLHIFSVTKNSKARGSSFEPGRPKTSQTFLQDTFPVNLGQREVRFFSRTSVISIHHLRETKSISIQLLCLHQHPVNGCTTYHVGGEHFSHANSAAYECRKRKFIRKRNNTVSSHLA